MATITAHPIGSCDLVKVGTVTLQDDCSRHMYPGVICVPGQGLLLADFCLNNVKLYNHQTGDILAKSEDLDLVWDVCSIDENGSQVAVTLRDGRIQIMSVLATGPSPFIRSLKVLQSPLDSCRGVSAIPKQDKLVVGGMYRSMQCWCVVSVSGEKVGTIHEICKYGGFGYSYLVTSENEKCVFISCFADKSSDTGVYGYIVESGERIFTYQHSDLYWPRGICADKRGFIYVCNQHLDNRSIYQLTVNGEPVKIFILEILSDPQAICLDENQETLFITYWGKNQISSLRLVWKDHAETSRAHEVFGSDGSKQPAQDRDTLTKTDKTVQTMDPVGQIYSSDLTTPNELQTPLQKRTLPPGTKYHAFFSYSSSDIHWVKKTVETLEKDHGLVCSEYDRDSTPGTPLLQFASDSIRNAYKTVIVMTREAFQSPFLVHEIHMAMFQGFNKGQKFVVPILLKDCEVPTYLSVLNYVDARDPKRRDIWWPKLLMELETAETSQAHEVFGSDGSKQQAQDGETLTQTKKTIVDEGLERIKTGVLPSVEVPRDHEDTKQVPDSPVPEEILHMDERSIELYKEILRDGKEKVYSIRVMVIGQHGVGKTMLTKRLLGQAVDPSEINSTEGIDIHIHCCSVSLDSWEWTLHAQEVDQYARLQRLVEFLHDQAQKLDVGSKHEDQDNVILQRGASPKAGDEVPVKDTENQNKSISFVQYIGQENETISARPVSLYPVEVNQAYRKMDPMRELVQQVNESAHMLQRGREKNAPLAMWDFAGQYVYYTTHQTFLTRRAIYLLVMDLSKQVCELVENDECFFDSEGTKVCKVHDLVNVWLSSIHSCATSTEPGTPPVILVGTHLDQIPQTSLQDDTAKYFEQIRLMLQDKPTRMHLTDEDFVIDNTINNICSDPNLEALKRKIVELASRQPYWGEEVPARWLLLEKAIMTLKAVGLKIVTLSIVEEINRSEFVQIETKEEMDLFLRFQHEIGTILYFSTEQLREKIVLDPQWLIDALKSLITAKRFILMNNPIVSDKWREFSEKGKLTPELTDAIWTKEKHKEFYENKEHILLLMEKLNIVARPSYYDNDGKITEEEYLLAPCMLRQKTPLDIIYFESNKQTEGSSVLCYVFTGKVLPSPVFHRLLAVCVARWPIAKRKSENLIFCGCGVFNLDHSHRLVIYFKDYAIFLRVMKIGFEDKTPSSNRCIEVRDFITWNLSQIIKNLGQSLCFELFLQCLQSTETNVDSLIPVSDLLQNAEIACRPHDDSHGIVSHDILKFWYEEKDYEHEQQPVI